jgi:hypothetical protein
MLRRTTRSPCRLTPDFPTGHGVVRQAERPPPYHRAILGTSVVRGDMADRVAARKGQDPYSHEPGSKPAPSEHCGSQFGKTDAFVSVIAP